jgi:hypothetical protein
MMHHLKEAVRNWRTSTAGVAAVVYAIADLIVMFHDSTWDAHRIGVDVMAIMTGVGLVSARDGVVSAEEHHEDRRDIRELKEEMK